jgi:alpha-D-xyloside xylohydrolase
MLMEKPFDFATRLRFGRAEGALAAPCSFADANGEYLRLSDVEFTDKQLYTTVVDGEPVLETRQTANGEVSVIVNARKVEDRMARRAVLRFQCGADELLTGLGQHEDGVYDYHGRTEYLYQNNMIVAVPFLLSSAGYGVLIEAECAMTFESGRGTFAFTLDAVEDFSVVVVRGADAAEALRLQAAVTGRTRLLPKWAYGYMQSKERYHSAEELEQTARRFRDEGLGLDCLVQDWHTWQEGLWGDKTPDPARFPSVSSLMDSLHGMDAHLLVSIWPNMAKGGADRAEFERAGKLLPNSEVYDAFDPDARALYAHQCEQVWGSGGVDGYWCDNAEPFSDADWNGETRKPDAERYRLVTESSARSIDETQANAYGLYHALGMYEHWRRNHPEKRMVNLTRSGYTGVQQYGTILWSGDISARWDVLRHQIAEGLKIAMSGISHWTLDAGGFFVVKDAYDKRGCDCAGIQKKLWFWNGDYNGGVDDPAYRELYVRWLQYACFLPVFRSHGTDTPREPWNFGKPGSAAYEAIRSSIAMRYKLLPYVYALAAQCWFTGEPMMRSLLTACPDDPQARGVCDSYLFGDALLIKPVTLPISEGGGHTEIYLPAGWNWTDWESGKTYTGGRTVSIETPLGKIPVFVKAGSILALCSGTYSANGAPPLASELDVYMGRDGNGVLYGDAGDGYAYEEGEYTRVPLRWNESAKTLMLGKAEGTAGLTAQLTIRFIAPDGFQTQKRVDYLGDESSVGIND